MSRSRRLHACLAIACALVVGSAGAAPDSSPDQMSAQCRQRVAKLFDETWPKRTLDAAGAQVNFEDHYSAKQKRCFFLETVSRLTHSPALKRILPRETQRLSDAVARRDYGKYDAWDDMPPLTCWLQETKCSSKEEWQQLIKPFMQD